MLQINNTQQLKRLRRLVLGKQGLLKAQPFGRGSSAAIQAINHLGYVQLDSISVVERAHHHVLHSRVPSYQPNMLEEMMSKGEIFEYWSHAAALLPIKDFRYSLPYKQAIKSGQVHWYKNPDQQLMKQLLKQIQTDGPLRSIDIAHPSKELKNRKSGTWWDWKPAKKALEQLYMQGDLMVSNRVGFQKTYDLTARVLPENVDTSLPSTEEFAAHLLYQQLRCYGMVSLKSLTYLRRNSSLRKSMKSLVDEQVAQQQLVAIKLPNEEVYWVEPNRLENPMLRAADRLVILSPFDNSVIQRDRLKDLFSFDYQIECYVPATKRQYGYFSLPLLYRDEFVGRMDCKAHRKNRVLEIKSLFLEPGTVSYERLIPCFIESILAFKTFQACESIDWHSAKMPEKFKQALANET